MVLAAGVFLVSWMFLLGVGAALVDEQAIINWMTENDWLKFLSPNIRNALVRHGWQLLAALALGVLSYRQVKTPAGYLARRYFTKGTFCDLRWLNPTGFGLPQPEFVFILPGNAHSCELVLKNNGPGSTRVSRIELEAHIYRQIVSQSVGVVRVVVPYLSLDSERNDIGLEWKKLSDSLWVIDTPFTVQESEEVYLPLLDPQSDESDDDAIGKLRQLVGLATLEIQFEAALSTEQQMINASLSAPLRIFLPLEEDDDGGVGALLSALNVEEVSERESLRESYQRVRRFDFDVRKGIASGLNELQEMEKLQSLSEEIAPYDQAIELQPEDPNAHYARGHKLAEIGILIAALGSLDKAAELGLDNPDLHLDRAKVLTDLSRSEDALDALERVFALGSNEAVAYTTKGRALHNLRRYKDALDACNRAIELDPNLASAHHCRGLALISMHSEEEALRAFDRATEIEPGFALAHVGRALALIGRGRDGEIITALSEALSLGYTDMGVLMKFETVLEEDARTELRRILKSHNLRGKNINEDVE
jgi:tetratricopeptide (TPR) repeat protein